MLREVGCVSEWREVANCESRASDTSGSNERIVEATGENLIIGSNSNSRKGRCLIMSRRFSSSKIILTDACTTFRHLEIAGIAVNDH